MNHFFISKSKKVFSFLFVPLAVFLTLLISNGSFAQASELKVLDITPAFKTENVPEEAEVGETGSFTFELEDVHGVPATGTITYRNYTPETLSIDEKGNWKALAEGTAKFWPEVTYSDETMDALKKKYPDTDFAVRAVAYVVRIEVVSTESPAAKPLFRLYNPNSGEHFFTAEPKERDKLKNAGWKYEDIAWMVPLASDTPVYRLYNPNAGDHHYTTSKKEASMLVSKGWSDEDIAFYSWNNTGEEVYRLYNPNAVAGAHHFTKVPGERDALIKAGWKDEDVAFYGLR